MSAASTNHYDIYSWILKNIESCTSKEQMKSAYILLLNWKYRSGLEYDHSLFISLIFHYETKSSSLKKAKKKKKKKKNDTIQLNS